MVVQRLQLSGLRASILCRVRGDHMQRAVSRDALSRRCLLPPCCPVEVEVQREPNRALHLQRMLRSGGVTISSEHGASVRPEWLFEIVNQLQAVGAPSDSRLRVTSVATIFSRLPAASAFERQLQDRFVGRLRVSLRTLRRKGGAPEAAWIEHESGSVTRRRLEHALDRAQELLEHHCYQTWSIEKLSRRVGCNRTDLQRGFRRRFGMTIHQYVISCRVAEAKRTLRSSPWRVEEIAKAAGFRSKVSLYAHFRPYVGMTPAEYRQRWEPTEPNDVVRRLCVSRKQARQSQIEK
jgi:AraC-like DNA-binding protein